MHEKPPLGKEIEKINSKSLFPLMRFIEHEKFFLFSTAIAKTLMNKVWKIDEQGLARICKRKQGCS
ncbi:hypothetical protein DB41_HW00010 [Neochlamydia sp. TUME1]|nr:hypothetical protein DB41_HW00010 [Neochlamydia sp. TUME1]